MTTIVALCGLGTALVSYLVIHHLDRRIRRLEAAFEVLRISTLRVLAVLEEDLRTRGKGAA
jgi:hypothetical protein